MAMGATSSVANHNRVRMKRLLCCPVSRTEPEEFLAGNARLSKKTGVADRAGHDEDTDVVRTCVGRMEKEPWPVGPIGERGAGNHLTVEEGDLHPAPVPAPLKFLALDVRGVPKKVADEEHRFESRQRDNHPLAGHRIH